MRNQSESGATIAAALVLIIGMGFGRFAFTGLYPPYDRRWANFRLALANSTTSLKQA
ncbi:hypothetical protein CEV32_4924 [Brucella rhizosphaerae]|uniref:Uncharacterized protein n=2 Tax=Brucella rhizosphaerae TaxID=571254 RepID=A0A256FXL5_9HYPH|nr:hypothetical protein CEV32_4924 [Brucella rhizosphaerae]